MPLPEVSLSRVINLVFQQPANATFWSALGALATFVAALHIFLARKQLQLEAWLKAQEIFTGEQFTKARGNLFMQLENPQQTWTAPQKDEAKLVCRKMSELADLVPVLDKKKMLDTWDDPVGKAWLILEPFVKEERFQHCRPPWPKKWQSFENLGRMALDKLVREGGDPRTMRRKEGQAA